MIFQYGLKNPLFYYTRPYLCFPIRTRSPEIGLRFGVNIFTLINFVLTLKDCQWVTYAIDQIEVLHLTSYIGRQSSVLPYS